VLICQDRSDETNTLTGVSDSVNGAWSNTVIGPFDNPGASNAQRSYVLIFPNTAAGTPVVTMTWSGTINTTCLFLEATGVDTTTPLGAFDASPANANNGTAYATNAIVPSRACLVVSLCVTSGNQTFSGVTAGYTDILPLSGRTFGFVASNAGVSTSVSGTIAGATSWTGHILSLLEPAAAGGNANLLEGKFGMKLAGKL
jgi:hypothetical protein